MGPMNLRRSSSVHPRNQTGRKSLDKLAADPRILEVWEEGSDGYWATLAPGWNFDGCSCIHEWTVAGMYDALRNKVTKGECY